MAASTLSGVAAVNGTRLYYEITGAGRPLVLLPGFALDTRMWRDQAAALKPDFLVVACDLRGFGRSNLPTGEAYSHTADLRALLDYLEIERAAVAGLSRGGRWAIQFALDYPERVTALISADALPDGFRTGAAGPAQSPTVLAASAQSVAAARRTWFEHPLFAAARRQPKVRRQLWAMVADYSGWHWYHPDPLVVSQPPAAQRLAAIAVPTLALAGEHDDGEYRRAAQVLAQTVSGARYEVIPRAGHLSNMENPAAFNQAVRDFLN